MFLRFGQSSNQMDCTMIQLSVHPADSYDPAISLAWPFRPTADGWSLQVDGSAICA